MSILAKTKLWAATATNADFWFGLVVLAAASAVCFYYAFFFLRKKRVITGTPTAKVRSAAQGYVELSGRGELLDDQPIFSPLTRAPCVWYEIRVEEMVPCIGGKGWKTITRETSPEPFLLKDGTGECVIDPEGARVTVTEHLAWRGHSERPSRRPDKVGMLGRFLTLLDHGGPYRYTEKLIRKNDTVYAIGLFKTVGGAGAELDAKVDIRNLIREWKEDSATLMARFDANKDGELCLEEWQRVREEAYKEVMKRHRHEKTLPPVHTLGKTRDRRRPYLLSSLDQAALVRRLHRCSVSCFLVFASCGTLAALIAILRISSR